MSKYRVWYDRLISKAVHRLDVLEYSEMHHIIPRCAGGINDKSNLVRLSFREHFIAHALLCKIYKDTQFAPKLNYAFMCMHNQRNNISTETVALGNIID